MSGTLLERALVLATVAHHGVMRKHTNEPYVTHPIAVMRILMDVGFSVVEDEDVLAAALLHDTIEDTSVTEKQIEIICNKRVANLVVQLTDVSMPYRDAPYKWNREKRKKMDLDHLATSDYYGASIKLADLLHNTESIVAHDAGFAVKYMAEKKALLEVLKHGHVILHQRASSRVFEYERTGK